MFPPQLFSFIEVTVNLVPFISETSPTVYAFFTVAALSFSCVFASTSKTY
jgi:hypothetical protein